MQSAKHKVSNMASAAKEKIQVAKAKVEEEAQQATARTKEEKDIATELRKVKEAEAKAELHNSKAKHTAEKLDAKQLGHHYHMPGTGIVTGADHVPVKIGNQQAYGAAGNIPGTRTTTTTTHNQVQPPHYNKHL
ncbi:late embryogenesis abundant protein 18-like [Chenopodium quinoa]|uniref:Seed maturation protein n=1 Tax=Chenopodium quinoa TaxID=63459 RepID=A0A803LU34_CHEQI|nr:late embryogenesis abundant protein 18-like [Chenopodium quinoa]